MLNIMLKLVSGTNGGWIFRSYLHIKHFMALSLQTKVLGLTDKEDKESCTKSIPNIVDVGLVKREDSLK